MRVEFDGYMHDIKRERARGRRRARRRRDGPPLAPCARRRHVSALAGRRVLITGASGAFGRAVADELRARGAHVAGLDLEPDDERGVIAGDVIDDRSARGGSRPPIARLGGTRRAREQRRSRRPGERWRAAGRDRPADVRGQHVRRLASHRGGADGARRRAAGAWCSSRRGCRSSACRSAPPTRVSKRGLTAYADALRAEYRTHLKVTCVHPAMVKTPIHEPTKAAGLSLEGVSSEEPLEAVVATIVRACEARAPGARRPRHTRRSAPAVRGAALPEARGSCGRAAGPAARRVGRLRRRAARRGPASPPRRLSGG